MKTKTFKTKKKTIKTIIEFKCTCYDDGVMCVWDNSCPVHLKTSIYDNVEIYDK